jgi:hypothetical protein
MREIKLTGPHIGTILAFCDQPSVREGDEETEREREKENKKGK